MADVARTLDDDERRPVVTGSPERIWLSYGDLDGDCTHDQCFEVDWWCDPQFPSDVEYVLAARLRAAEQRVAELDKANVGLAIEAERLRSGLRFYAHREHIAGFDGFSEGDDPESPDWLCDPNPSGNMIETGGVARTVLSGQTPAWDGDEPMEHPCEPGMAALTERPA